MDVEVQQVEQTEEACGAFEAQWTIITTPSSQRFNAFFASCRVADTSWWEGLSRKAKEAIEAYSEAKREAKKGVDPDEDMPDALKAVLGNKEATVEGLNGSHDIHVGVIDTKEDVLVSKEKNECALILEAIKAAEHSRNRTRILEIVSLIEKVVAAEIRAVEAQYA